MDPHNHDAQMGNLERIIAHQREVGERLDQMQAQHAERPAPPLLDPAHYETTIAQARRMTERETHPSWFHAAYADLAGRLARVEDLLEELDASMSLLHTKMETIIGQLVAAERRTTQSEQMLHDDFRPEDTTP
jgi:phage shock protein A